MRIVPKRLIVRDPATHRRKTFRAFAEASVVALTIGAGVYGGIQARANQMFEQDVQAMPSQRQQLEEGLCAVQRMASIPAGTGLGLLAGLGTFLMRRPRGVVAGRDGRYRLAL